MGPHRYALMVVAEPLPHEEMDAALDRCRRLRGEIHAYIRTTTTRGTSSSHTEGRTEVQEVESWANQLPMYLMGMNLFLQVVGIPFLGMQSAPI